MLRPVGVGHFWVSGFSQSLGGWVSQITPCPLPHMVKQNPDLHMALHTSALPWPAAVLLHPGSAMVV